VWRAVAMCCLWLVWVAQRSYPGSCCLLGVIGHWSLLLCTRSGYGSGPLSLACRNLLLRVLEREMMSYVAS
jgi:hypothetical protein